MLERNTDMTTFERIKNLAKQKDKSLQQVARELKYGENYFYSLNALCSVSILTLLIQFHSN